MDSTTDSAPADDPTAAERKRALRRQARARRAATDPSERERDAERWSRRVAQLARECGARVVAVYDAYGTEPPTARLVEVLHGSVARVIEPRLLEDSDLDWFERIAPETALGVAAIADADLVVVPALLVGEDGARLGQGGGSYDRALRRLRPGTPVVALVHDDELVAADVIPVETHDVRVTHVVTPRRTVVVADLGIPVDVELEPARRGGEFDVALVVAAGGALGSAARWGLNEALPRDTADFPWATFLENVVGAFVLGVVAVALLRLWGAHRYARPFLAVGVLGGFTTFSTYVAEIRALTDDGHAATGVLYLLLTLVVGLAAAVAGLLTGRATIGRRR